MRIAHGRPTARLVGSSHSSGSNLLMIAQAKARVRSARRSTGKGSSASACKDMLMGEVFKTFCRSLLAYGSVVRTGVSAGECFQRDSETLWSVSGSNKPFRRTLKPPSSSNDVSPAPSTGEPLTSNLLDAASRLYGVAAGGASRLRMAKARRRCS